MKRLLGFALFFFSLGIAFTWIVVKSGWELFCTAVCLIVSYLLFFC